jgi:hypothetical protein
MRYIINKD